MRLTTLSAAACALGLSLPAAARPQGPPAVPAVSTAVVVSAPPMPPPEVGSLDAIGRPVSADARAAYERFLTASAGKDLAEADYRLVLTLLNLPPVDPGPFRDREDLVRYFMEAGVRVGDLRKGGLTESDLWRLVRAARAAAQSYRIPPAVIMCLTFCESGFNRRASAWTTSAKGVAQMTNPAVEEIIKRIWRSPILRAATEGYAAQLGASIPAKFVGAADVDALTAQLDALARDKAPPAEIRKKKKERQKAIKAHKDEAGHIYNIETNFGLAAAYLSYLRKSRLTEVPDERKGWLSAVGAYNQGIGYANSLIKMAGGPGEFNRLGLKEAFSRASIWKLEISRDRRQEMLDEIDTVRACAIP